MCNPQDASDAAGDLDNDGVSNLDEYLYGTDIAQADSDGDGISDGEEIAQGYNPVIQTRFVYVSDTTGNDENDGLSSASAKKTLKSAISASQECNFENVIFASTGTYKGIMKYFHRLMIKKNFIL